MTAAIRIRGLEKTYATGMRALKGIDLEVREGDFFALLGPNGAGKSTTIGILSSLVNKSAGPPRNTPRWGRKPANGFAVAFGQ